jgi:hypothetical protein
LDLGLAHHTLLLTVQQNESPTCAGFGEIARSRQTRFLPV